jgi:protein-S-isoprenylcysteine O-methyltransferase Ste14
MKASRLRKLTLKLLFVYALVIVLIAFADPKLDKWKHWNFGVGVGLLVGSLWIRMWAAGHLVKNKVLTVTGPYAYVKNPLYIGTFLGMVGFAFLTLGDPRQHLWYIRHLNWILLGVGILIFVAYYIPYKKKREGDRLHLLFGEAWDHYDRSVPDYVPRLHRYERAQDRPWSWAATCENSEQWTPLAMAVGLAAVIWNGWIIQQVHHVMTRVQ